MRRKKAANTEGIKADLIGRKLTPLQMMELVKSKISRDDYELSDGTARALTEIAMPELEEQEKTARHGKKFKGRKPGSGGPIRKAIAKLLARSPAMENPQLWKVIKNNLPKGWSVDEPKYFDFEPGLVGPNMETDHMSYRRFCNVCCEERKKVMGEITS